MIAANAENAVRYYDPARARIIHVSAAHGGSVDGPTIASALHHLRERLVVMTRGNNSIPMIVASLRRVPVLIVEPAKDKIASVSGSRSAA
jgi:hypothetical protein